MTLARCEWACASSCQRETLLLFSDGDPAQRDVRQLCGTPWRESELDATDDDNDEDGPPKMLLLDPVEGREGNVTDGTDSRNVWVKVVIRTTCFKTSFSDKSSRAKCTTASNAREDELEELDKEPEGAFALLVFEEDESAFFAFLENFCVSELADWVCESGFLNVPPLGCSGTKPPPSPSS
jgi:hypothetical protein